MEAIRLIMAKKWIFYRHKPYHFGWTRSWNVCFIENAVNQGWLYKSKEII